MSVNRLIGLCCFVVVCPIFAQAQVNLNPRQTSGQKSWSLLVAPGLSKSKLPNGDGFTFANNYYVNLRIREPFLFSYRLEISQSTVYKNGWSFSKGLGLSSYSYVLHYEYDREASIGTNLTDRMDFNYVYATLKFGKQFSLNKFSVEPYVALDGNFLIAAKYTYTNKFGGGSSNFTNKYKPWALGFGAGLKFKYQVNEAYSMELHGLISKVQKKYSDRQGPPGERLNYSYNIGLGVSKKILRDISK